MCRTDEMVDLLFRDEEEQKRVRNPCGSRHFSLDNNSIVVVVGFELSAGVGVVLEEKFLFPLGSAVDSHLSGLGSRAL